MEKPIWRHPRDEKEIPELPSNFGEMLGDLKHYYDSDEYTKLLVDFSNKLNEMAVDKLMYGVQREEGICSSKCPKCCDGKTIVGAFTFNSMWIDCEYCDGKNTLEAYLMGTKKKIQAERERRAKMFASERPIYWPAGNPFRKMSD